MRSHHEIAHLFSPKQHFKIDIHRSFIHQQGRENFHEKLNKEVWASAQKIKWGDIYIWAPWPLDCILCGLVAHRLWSGAKGKGQILLRDYLDFKVLIDKFWFTDEALLRRARELGIHQTTLVFLESCDPFKTHFVSPSGSWSGKKERIAHESRPIVRQGDNLKLSLLIKRVFDMTYFFPQVIKTIILNALTRDTHQLLDKLLTSSEIKPVSLGVISRDINKAIEHMLRWCQPQEKRSRLYALTLFKIYRNLGQPVSFVQGNDENGKKHAWIELAGIPVSGANDSYARRKYCIEYQFPPEAQE